MKDENQFDAIVAGAGIWGCTVARRLAEAGRRVLVLEKRAAVGGNCRCEMTDGIEVHLYGSHIFHTSNEAVWKFVTRFTAFNDYRHCVLAKHKGKLYHLPIGCTLLKEFFGRDVKPSAMTDDERTQLFDAFIRGYTSKQWGVPPEKVDPSVIARLKVRDNFSTDYFDDPHQGIPLDGYNKMFERMLDHPNVTIETEMTVKVVGADLRAARNPGSTQPALEIDCGRAGRSPLPVYYSGPIDALFDYKYGHLPWRTLRFETERLEQDDFQGTTVVNYTDADVPFTRIHEFRHYHPEWGWGSRSVESKSKNGIDRVQSRPKTVIMREYSSAWQPGDEPYYPIDNADSRALLARYQSEVARINSSTSASNFNLIVGGRLGGYKYYDMDKSVAAALEQELV